MQLSENFIKNSTFDYCKFQFMKKISLLVIMLFAPEIILAQHTDIINSNRPGESMTAYSVGRRVSQIESGVSGIHESHNLLGTNANGVLIDMNVRYGVFKEELEVIGEFKFNIDKYTEPLVSETRAAFRKSNIGLKYLVYDPHKYYKEEVNIFSWKANNKFKWRQLIPAVALYAGADLNFPNDPFKFIQVDVPIVTPRAMLITQNQFGNRWVFVTNSFMEFITSPTRNYGYIVTLTHTFNPKFSGFLENKGLFGDYYSDQIMTTGVAYLLDEQIQLDASISKNFKNTPNLFYGGLGFSIRFDKRHKEIILKDRDPKDNSKKAKETKEDKKRRKEKERVKEAIEG